MSLLGNASLKISLRGTVLFALLVLFITPSHAAFTTSGSENQQKVFRALQDLQNNIQSLEKRLEAKKKELTPETPEPMRVKIEAAIERMDKELLILRQNFAETATGIEIGVEVIQEKLTKRNLFEEFQEVLAPVINTFKRVSAKPRKIEHIRFELSQIDEESTEIDKGLKRWEEIVGDPKVLQVKNPELWAEMHKARQSLDDTKHDLSLRRSELERKLSIEMSENRSVMDLTEDFISVFFKERGKNLLISFLLIVLVLWSFHYFREKLFRSKVLQKFSGLDKTLRVLYNTMAIFSALMAAILGLYVLNDWALLTFIVLIIVACIWSFKQFLPKFLTELRLILNLGSVREGERLIWKGIAWKVTSIGPYSTLENELLTGGRIRLPAVEIVKMQSRSWDKAEEWFPCKTGDWVELKDGHYGRIGLQTPDQVILRSVSGETRYYQTTDFLALTPKNYSNGFFLDVELGLDYGLQKEIVEKIPARLEAFLGQVENPWKEGIESIKVEFSRPSEEALLLWVRFRCRGSLGGSRSEIKRWAYQRMVELCNKEKWNFPINQITVHSSGKAL